MANKIAKLVPAHLNKKKPEDVKLYNALKKASFDNMNLSMSEILKRGARKELKRMGYLKK